MSVNHMAQLVCKNPAERYGLSTKGDIEIGYDADIVLLDPEESFVVRAADSESSQGYTPFEGMELNGRVKSTFLRGRMIYDNGNIVGGAGGRYLSRPGKRPTFSCLQQHRSRCCTRYDRLSVAALSPS